MPPEIALVESRALRDSVSNRTEALDKVKVLVLLPDGLYVTTQLVADYFEVGEKAINTLMQRHRAELESNGFRVLTGSEMVRFVNFNLKSTQVRGRGIAVYDRRAVLNVAMLLRDSEVARAVRSYLLDLVLGVVPEVVPGQRTAGPPRRGRPLGPGPHWDEWEACSRSPQNEAWRQVIDGEVQVDVEPPPVDARLDGIDQRLDAHARVINAMGSDLTHPRYGLNRPPL